MKYKVRTLQKALPFYYFLVLFLTFALLVSFFCVYYLKNLRASEYTNLQNLSRSVTSDLHQEVETMSTVSLNAIYSKSIIPEITALFQPDISSQEQYTKQQEIYKSIFDIIGLQQNIAQVNIYSALGKVIGSGMYTYQKSVPFEEQHWFQDVSAQNGYRYMTLAHPLPYHMSASPFSRDLNYISLVRLYYDNAHEVSGAVEILENCDDFFHSPEETISQNNHLSIYIVNEKQKLVYPLDSSEEHIPLYYEEKFQNHALTAKSVHLLKDEEGEKHAVIKSSVSSVGWNIYITKPDSVIVNSLTVPVLFFMFLLVILLGITLLICFMISGRILFPLKQLQNTFESIHSDDLLSSSKDSLLLPESHYAEIKTLISAFQDMYEKLNHSTALMLQSKAEELKAKEIATQSLMKPHFLYNNLANISIMAEENMNQEIITLTENLCDYLRYTSSAGSSMVSIKDEFFYTEKYLLCMKVRYKDRLSYSFSLNQEEENITVPKLIVQPLVENALKYAFFRNPPWNLEISCFRRNGFWCISVKDNGAGFSEEIKEEIFKNLEKIRYTQDISQLHIGGMGLSNVFLRLLLMYGENIIFEIENNTHAGACVTIGGKINHDKNTSAI